MPQVYFLEIKKPNNQALKKAAQAIAPLFDGLFQTNDKTALKLHFGEKPSCTYIQPAFVEAIYHGLQEKGVSSTLVDCNVLYKSPRSLGSTHLQLAKEQGFNFAPIAILDGEKGEKEMLVPLENTKHFQTAKIGPLKAEIDFNKCLGCGQCIALCSQGAVQIPWGSASSAEAQERLTEYAKAALKNKKAFFINLLLNITQRCDCVREKQKPFLKDIGILASSDITAIDQASLDLAGKENFTSADTNPQVQINHAEKIGLGSKQYTLTTL